MATDFCDYAYPPDTCQGLITYLQDIIDTLIATPRVKYFESLIDADSDTLDSLWGECGPPDCAVVVWNNTNLEEYSIWSYVNSAWRSTGTSSYESAYYTEFGGSGGPLGAGWQGQWVIDGEGKLFPRLTLSGTELLLNGDFEDWTGGNADNWTLGDGTWAQELTTVRTGASSLRLNLENVVGPPVFQADILQTVAVTEARWYRLIAYMRVISEIDDLYMRDTQVNIDSTSDFSGWGKGWIRITVGDFTLVASITYRIDASDGPVAVGDPPKPSMYIDSASLQEITDGWNTKKEFYTANGTIYADITIDNGNFGGLLINYVDDDNYAFVSRTSAAISLVEVSSGASSETNTWGTAYVAGARLEVSRNSDDTVDIDYNGANVVTGQALASPLTGTEHGMVATSPYTYFTAFGFTPE